MMILTNNSIKDILIMAMSIFVLLTVLGNHEVRGQDLDNMSASMITNTAKANEYINSKKALPLKQILTILEEHYDVAFLYKGGLVNNKMVKNPDIQIGEKTGEQLSIIIDSLGLKLHRVNKTSYIVLPKPFEGKFKQQVQTVSGTVTDAQTGNTMPGVNVVLKGTTTGTSTDSEGTYELEVPSLQDILIFSFIGYQTQEIPINGRTQIDVELLSQAVTGENVVVVGYGTQRRQDVTGSIATGDVEVAQYSPNESILQSLRGTVPGLNIGQTTRPGQEPSFDVRGRTSLAGEQTPLVVVDGVIFRGNLIDLKPSNVKSVEILKGVSATAVYGNQAANGVILVTTKTGLKNRAPEINVSVKTSIESPTQNFGTGTVDDFILKTERSNILESRTPESGFLEKNPDWNPTTVFKTTEELNAFNDGRSFNWYDYLTRDNLLSQDYDFSVNGGGETTSYLVSMGFNKEKGNMINDQFNRINARVNLDNQVNEWIDVGIRSFVNRANFDGPDISPNLRFFSPNVTIFDGNGDLVPITGGNTVNPRSQRNAPFNSDRLNLFGNIFANVNIPFIEGLSYQGNISNNYITNKNDIFQSFGANFQGSGSKFINTEWDWITDHIISYTNNFKNVHDVDLTLLYGWERRRFKLTGAEASIFPTDALGFDNLAFGSAGLQEAISGREDESSLYQMARLKYVYNDKYLITGTIRRDGFSGFTEDNRFGVFPSVSVGWVITEEPFINADWLDRAKFRLERGQSGNRTIGRNQSFAEVETGFGFVDADENSIFTRSISELANKNLKWETTKGWNVGLDFEILGSRISGTMDWFHNRTVDLLQQVDLPFVSGFGSIDANLGKLRNKGFETSISTINIQNQELRWESTFTFSKDRNRLKELIGIDADGDGKEDDLVSEGLFIGESIDAIFGFKTDGLWQVGDDIPPFSDLGARRTVDLNGDGEITRADDRTIIGNRRPGYRFSIINKVDYKNWSLRMVINSVQGGGNNRYLAENDLLSFGIVNQENHFNRAFPKGMDFWYPRNPDAKFQRPNININQGLSERRFESRSFVRVQDISLSYNIPQEYLSSIGFQGLTLFVSGQNLWTITGWEGFDPETGVGIERGGRPVMRSITTGIDITF